MNYAGGAFRYAFKNFIFLFLFALLPSYFLAMSTDAENARALFAGLFGEGDVAFTTFFFFLSPFNAHGWPYALVAFVLAAVCLPMLTGFIEKHMRIGIRSLHGLRSRFNHNFVSTLVLLFVFVAVYELWALIAAGLLYAETLLFGGVASAVIVVCTFAGLAALVCYLASLVLLWLPSLQITGYAFMDALACANALYSAVRGRLFCSVTVPALVGLVVQFVSLVLIPARLEAVDFLVRELVFLILLLYFAALMFVAYFAASGEERQDLVKNYGSEGRF